MRNGCSYLASERMTWPANWLDCNKHAYPFCKCYTDTYAALTYWIRITEMAIIRRNANNQHHFKHRINLYIQLEEVSQVKAEQKRHAISMTRNKILKFENSLLLGGKQPCVKFFNWNTSPKKKEWREENISIWDEFFQYKVVWYGFTYPFIASHHGW